MCAEFLGWKNGLSKDNVEDTLSSFYLSPSFSREYWSTGTSISREGWDTTEYFKPEQMLFDSDWNWITEVKKAIVDLKLKISPQIHRVYFNVFSCRKNHPEYEYDYKVRVYTDFKDLEIKTESNDEKEAVVEAIWNFLNWYNEHISKTFR